MTEIERIADQLRRAHQGEAWHGQSLEEILKGVTAETAIKRSFPGSHNIWEIVLHIGVWESIVRRRLSGEVVLGLTPEQDWPPASDSSEAAWKSTLEELRHGHEEMQKVIARLADRQLVEPVPGMGYNVYFMLHGTVQHTLYHAGQIAILKKAAIH
ncbi:MAG: DinB family protein [Acidobacteria bacterium]|nr:DinB family protein [Acidobacteriota bacterium]